MSCASRRSAALKLKEIHALRLPESASQAVFRALSQRDERLGKPVGNAVKSVPKEHHGDSFLWLPRTGSRRSREAAERHEADVLKSSV